MPFTVRDFHSLVRGLERNPEWKAELRRLLLSEDVLSLPEIVRQAADQVRQLAEAQRRTEERLNSLTDQVRQLAEAQRRTEERLNSLTDQVQQLAEAQRRTEEEVGRLAREVGDLKGSDLERRYRERAASFFQGLVRRIRVIDHQDLGHLLDDAVDSGRISPEEKAEIMQADVVLSGRRDDTQVYVVVEVSAAVDRADVDRAARRANFLEKAIGAPVLPVVAGQRILADAERRAVSARVWRVLDGTAQPPP